MEYIIETVETISVIHILNKLEIVSLFFFT